MNPTTTAAESALPVPRIFVSATTGDLGSVRRAVANGLRGIGALAVEQEYFAPPGQTIAAMLEEKIKSCQAVIHIAGHRYGAEDENAAPALRGATYAEGRRSYTQLEHDLALRHGKRLYVFVCADAFPYDPVPAETFAPAEPAALAALQQEHRRRLLASSHFRHSVGSADELTKNVAKLDEQIRTIAEELHRTRRRQRIAIGIGASAIVALAAGGWHLAGRTDKVEKTTAEANQRLTKTEQAVTDVLAENRAIVAKVASLYNETTDLKETLTTEQKFDRAIQRTADAEKLTKGDILARVDSFIASVRAREKEGRADFYDLGLAAFAEKNFTKAAEFAVKAAVEADQDIAKGKTLAVEGARLERAGTLKKRSSLKLAGDSEKAAVHYGAATQHYRNAAALYDQKTEPEEWASASTLHAIALWRDGKYDQGALIAENILEARERTLGKEHPDTLVSLGNLAEMYRAKGEAEKAEKLYVSAIEVQERRLGKDHPNTLSSVSSLAGVFRERGDYKNAESLYVRAMEARERTLGKEHSLTLVTVNNLAMLYSAKGNNQKAEPLLMRALEAQERSVGKNHPDTLVVVNNLAELYRDKDDVSKAEQFFLRALEGLEPILGKDHPDTLTVVNNLAGLYRSKDDDIARAEPLYLRALEAQERTLGKDHPDTLTTVNNLGLLYSKGDAAKAMKLYLRALDAQERTLGKEHPSTLTTVWNLGQLYNDQGDAVEAEKLYVRFLKDQERTLGKDHPRTLIVVINLGILYFRQADLASAEPLVVWAREAQERTLGKDHPDTCLSSYNLAMLYKQQGKKERVPELARQAYDGWLKSFGAEHERTKGAAALLRAMGETP